MTSTPRSKSNDDDAQLLPEATSLAASEITRSAVPGSTHSPCGTESLMRHTNLRSGPTGRLFMSIALRCNCFAMLALGGRLGYPVKTAKRLKTRSELSSVQRWHSGKARRISPRYVR